MKKLIQLIVVIFGCALAALLEDSMDLAKSLGLIGGVLLVALTFLVLLRGSVNDADEPKPNPPGRNWGPDCIIYPDPPHTTPELRGPGPEQYAPRGELAENQPALAPMRREPVEQPIEVEPDWVFTPRSREGK